MSTQVAQKPGYRSVLAVNEHATDPLTNGVCDAIYVGGTGDIICRLAGDSADITFSAVPVGATLEIAVSHVRVSGASLMLALYY